MERNLNRIFAHEHKLDRQGYDRAGRYFGVGERLYYIERAEVHGYVRAPDRQTAMAWVALYGVERLDTYGIDDCRRLFGFQIVA